MTSDVVEVHVDQRFIQLLRTMQDGRRISAHRKTYFIGAIASDDPGEKADWQHVLGTNIDLYNARAGILGVPTGDRRQTINTVIDCISRYLAEDEKDQEHCRTALKMEIGLIQPQEKSERKG